MPTSSTPENEIGGSDFVASLRAKRDRAQESVAAHHARWEKAETSLAEQLHELFDLWEARQEQADARIQELESLLAKAKADHAAGKSAGARDQDAEDARRRHEMAMEDLRELTAKNKELQQQLAKLQAVGTKTVVASGPPAGVLDWEAEKRRITAMLESEGEPTAERRAERLKIEDVVRKTSQLIAEKDKEIDELRAALAKAPQPETTPTVADEHAFNALLDKDEVIREERARLQALQDEWRNKLRQAEVELSLERAALARQRAQLDGRRPAADAATQATSSTQPEKPSRGRWLAHLGLLDATQHPDKSNPPSR